jgi:hypothetical protein
MKANPGGHVTGEAILGRETEIGIIWKTLERQSVVLTAERRVGKTCVLRKMKGHPQNGWIPLMCFVEECGHPIECVQMIYDEAHLMEAQSNKGVWLGRIRSAYQAVAGTEIAGWKMPPIMSDWKRLLKNLIEDVAQNTGNRILVMLDEFPLMISKIAYNKKDAGPVIAMDFLDTLRGIRQKFEPSNQIRFVFSGSIGLHLVLEGLGRRHEYKSNPKSDMFTYVLGGMCKADVQLMCRKYLDEEGIHRNRPSEFEERMLALTDGLPLYIQHVCSHFQESGRTEVSPDDIEPAVRELVDTRTIEGFVYAAQRIENYYKKLHLENMAKCILRMLSRKTGYVREKDIIDHVSSQMTVEHGDTVLSVLELLLDDNYLIRETSTDERRYRFRYNIMRQWWEINKG